VGTLRRRGRFHAVAPLLPTGRIAARTAALAGQRVAEAALLGCVQNEDRHAINLNASRLIQQAVLPQGDTDMNDDQIKGKAKDIGGKVQEEVGKVVGSSEQQAKGLSKQVEGKVQEKAGDLRDAIDKGNR
jgi:uncharacterized protein YjbJ (UPF0337 family)